MSSEVVIIQSQQNPIYRHAHKLANSRRERLKSGETLLDGIHLLQAWHDAARPLERILLAQSAQLRPEIAEFVALNTAAVTVLDDALFAELSELPSQSGVLALVRIPPAPVPIKSGFCLLLDGVQDPGNVGAMIRTAQAAGVEQVWLSAACADVWSPKVLRAGMGAQAVLPLIERADLSQLASGFEGAVAALLLDGATDLYATALSGSVALVLGSEGQGVSAPMAALAQVKVKIPMAGGIESLNVGHAAAICLYEKMRQDAAVRH